MINTTNLLAQKLNLPKTSQQQTVQPQPQNNVKPQGEKSNLLSAYLTTMAAINKPAVKKADTAQNTEKTAKADKTEAVKETAAAPINYHNDLRTLFRNNNAKIMMIIPRCFNANDKNGNDMIDGDEEHGTFKNAVKRLDEIVAGGCNTIHVLPISTPGKMKAMGTAGSVYSPKDLLEIDPMLLDKDDPRSPREQFKAFVDECHKRGIHVMLDLPSCASYDLFIERPELMAKERDGLAKTPQGWNDIRMFQPWKDEGKRTLNPKLLEYHKEFIDMCIETGVDGIRADVARAKPTEFWDILIPYSRSKDPEFAWLAETYTYEDASPQANMPFDRPMDSLRAGFDAFYGQFHIFHEWSTAGQFMDYIKENLNMTYKLDKGKSLIGSFGTHDDISPMFHGGVDYCNMTTVLQATLPMLNPYFVDGFDSGDYYTYSYANKFSTNTMTDNHIMDVHHGRPDIFNLSRKPGGSHPEIGNFKKSAFEFRDNPKYNSIITKGSFIELDKEGDKNDQIIAYARHLNGKTLLVLVNKNVDRAVACTVKVPTLKESQKMLNLLPSYGKESIIQAADGEVRIDLGPARGHVFEIDTPYIENHVVPNKIFKQNL